MLVLSNKTMGKQQADKGHREYREKNSLTEFFKLLLKIDRRINPDYYHKKLTKK